MDCRATLAKGLAPAGVSVVGVATAAAAVGTATSVNFTGEMFPSADYVVYITLRDTAATPNTSPVLAAVAVSTQSCVACDPPKAGELFCRAQLLKHVRGLFF